MHYLIYIICRIRQSPSSDCSNTIVTCSHSALACLGLAAPRIRRVGSLLFQLMLLGSLIAPESQSDCCWASMRCTQGGGSSSAVVWVRLPGWRFSNCPPAGPAVRIVEPATFLIALRASDKAATQSSPEFALKRAHPDLRPESPDNDRAPHGTNGEMSGSDCLAHGRISAPSGRPRFGRSTIPGHVVGQGKRSMCNTPRARRSREAAGLPLPLRRQSSLPVLRCARGWCSKSGSLASLPQSCPRPLNDR